MSVNAQRKYSVHFSRELPLFDVGKTLDFMFSSHDLGSLLSVNPPFRCGADTGFHVSSHDLNAKDFFKKVRKKKEEM